jgi:hypothetical protein
VSLKVVNHIYREKIEKEGWVGVWSEILITLPPVLLAGNDNNLSDYN